MPPLKKEVSFFAFSDTPNPQTIDFSAFVKKMNSCRLGRNSKKTPMTEKKITLNNYSDLLSQLRKHIDKTQKSITRQKVVMAWQIGKSLEEHLLKNNQSGYGEHLFEELESDLGIAQTVLYKMRSFYKNYPKLPQDDDKLNWSHYRILSGVKKDEDRKYLENLARENEWGSNTLQAETKKSKISQIRAGSVLRQKTAIPKKLTPKRGQLFFYKLTKLENSKKTYIDCGFNFFREVTEALPKGAKIGDQIVQSSKKNEKYSFAKVAQAEKKTFAYMATIERVIDGDTLHVILDLGFEISHREILRLRGINAPELSTSAGKKSALALKRILKKVPFVIVKTTATDVYGRYVCDVFLASEGDAQKAANDGVYLNQLLLDRGLAVSYLG